MADQPQDKPDELEESLTDVNLLESDIAQKADAPDDTAENKPDEGADAEENKPENKPEAKADGEGDKPEGEEKPSEGDQDTPAEEAKPDEDTDATKRHNAEMARQRIQNRTKQEVAKTIDDNYAPKTEAELKDEGLSDSDAKVEALRQEVAFNNRRAEVAELNSTMQIDAVNVQADYPVFNDKSPEYDPDFAKMVDEQYRVASRLQTDENGIILNAEVPLYDFYKRMADIYDRGASKGSQKRSAENAQMLAATENPGGSSSTRGNQGDSLEELEERLGGLVIT